MILTVIFVIAPNLFTDFQSVVTTFIAEARPNHVGQDGLGFIGNLKFYLQTIGDSFGLISYLMFAAGIAFLAKNRRFEHFPLLLSVIYWICLSALALFWVRWGLPMFLSYIMITAIGGVWVCEQAELLKKRGKVFKIAMTVLLALVVVNTTVSGIKVTKWSAMEDTRIAAMEFCTENNITQENSVYEGYTPIAPDFGKGAQYVSFEMDGDKVKVKEEHKDKKYFVLSSSFKNRYINNAADYPEAAAIYGNLDNSYPLIYEISGESYRSSALEVKSIYYGLKYIFEKESLTGLPIYIYDLQPEINEADREA